MIRSVKWLHSLELRDSLWLLLTTGLLFNNAGPFHFVRCVRKDWRCLWGFWAKRGHHLLRHWLVKSGGPLHWSSIRKIHWLQWKCQTSYVTRETCHSNSVVADVGSVFLCMKHWVVPNVVSVVWCARPACAFCFLQLFAYVYPYHRSAGTWTSPKKVTMLIILHCIVL
jgi:hypothetical protein